MTKTQLGKLYLSIGLIVILLMALSTQLVAQEPTSVRQEPTRVRPTVDPSGNTDSASSTNKSGQSAGCASVQGSAIHWGVGGLGQANVDLVGGGWQTNQITSDTGWYEFRGLGDGFGILQITPSMKELKPIIDKAIVRLKCDYATEAHIGLYSGDERPRPPGYIVQVAPRTAIPGDTIGFHFVVINTLPNPMSEVVVTDMFPDGLVIEDAFTSKGTIEILDGHLLTAVIGDVPENGQVHISVIASVADTLSVGSRLLNTATLFYAESAADQTSHVVDIGSSIKKVIPVSVQKPETIPANSDSANSIVIAVSQSDMVSNQASRIESAMPVYLPTTGGLTE